MQIKLVAEQSILHRNRRVLSTKLMRKDLSCSQVWSSLPAKCLTWQHDLTPEND